MTTAEWNLTIDERVKLCSMYGHEMLPSAEWIIDQRLDGIVERICERCGCRERLQVKIESLAEPSDG